MEETKLKKISTLARYWILKSTTEAGSGHPTSALSATDLMVGLMFGGVFRADLDQPAYHNNDRLIFSKGHAAPLLYALYAIAGKVSEKELMELRKFDSNLEGHPSMRFPYTEAATGSLGQGLSIGLGMAINAKMDKLSYRTYVLLGDSEMSEGSVWEALQIAAYYNLDNLVGIVDVNRLGQRGETMVGHNIEVYKKRIAAFGWKTIVIDGHSLPEIVAAYKKAGQIKGKPVMILAKTIKGKGVSFLEDKEEWHGRILFPEELGKALVELGKVDKNILGEVAKAVRQKVNRKTIKKISKVEYAKGELVATRQAYGQSLAESLVAFPNIVALDAETSNSTGAETFKKSYPERFLEMFIAEQNMVGVALGLSRRGKIPFVSTFAAFLTRAFDQIRMSQYSNSNVKFIGSHAGVSIGQDGPSQMGLEDIAMFRTLLGSVVLYPADAVAMKKLVKEAAKHFGNVYIRTTRKDTPVIYGQKEEFPIGGSKVLKKSSDDFVTIAAAGVTLFEALKAYEELKKEGITVRIIDLYSIKPLDVKTLEAAVRETKAIITVEDHFAQGGIGEAIRSVLSAKGGLIYSLAVGKMPKSETPEELLEYEEISSDAIIRKVKKIYAA